MRMALALSVLALVLPLSVSAQTNESFKISTLALVDPLYLPTDVAFDAAGNLYITDWSARIFKVAADTGLMTWVAGTGAFGFSGDGGPAIYADLGGPGSMTVDPQGNIYFGDCRNRRVRKVSASTGIITTIAGNGDMVGSGDGGPALNAGIGCVDVHIGPDGNLYFSDGGASVRKVTLSTGVISTVAGGKLSAHAGDGGVAVLAEVDQPSGLAFDAAGNLYIAARGEHRIRKVSAATGVITTIAGSSTGAVSGPFGMVVYQGGFAGDGGPAVDALLNDPERIALDGAGNIYISDVQNHRIRRIDAVTGIITTVAGTGALGYSGDGGPAASAEIGFPDGIVIDTAGRVLFSDEPNNQIRILTPISSPVPHQNLAPPPRRPVR